MRLHRLLAALLAWTLCASAFAADPPTRTLSCSLSGVQGGCMVEQPVVVVGALEVSVGVDARAVWGVRAGVAPYALVGWYAATWGVWGEFALPAYGPLRSVGRSEPWRVGFSVRF